MICPRNGHRAQDSGGAGIRRVLQGAEVEMRWVEAVAMEAVGGL